MNESLLYPFLAYLFTVLYYGLPAFLIGLSFQLLIIRHGNYKWQHKLFLLILLRISGLLLTALLWMTMKLTSLPLEYILIPAVISEFILFSATSYANQSMSEKRETDQ